MKQCTILLTAMAVVAMMGGCERSTANEQYEPFDKGTDAMTTDVGAGYVSGDLLADQVRVASAASAEKKRRQPAKVEPTEPTDTHLKDTGLKPAGAGADTGTGTDETAAGTGTGDGTDTGTGTGTGTGTTPATGTGKGGGGEAVDPLKDILGGGS